MTLIDPNRRLPGEGLEPFQRRDGGAVGKDRIIKSDRRAAKSTSTRTLKSDVHAEQASRRKVSTPIPALETIPAVQSANVHVATTDRGVVARFMRRFDAWLGVAETPPLNWKGRAIERLLLLRYFALERMVLGPERKIDRWLGVPAAPQLNWKGRAINRLQMSKYRLQQGASTLVYGTWRFVKNGVIGLALSLERLIDRALRVPVSPQLNWKGRAIERLIRVWQIVTWPVVGAPKALARHLDRRLRIAHAPYLNWKGRTIERARAIYARLTWSRLGDLFVGWASRALVELANSIFFQVYALRARLQRRTTVKSVLQLSIISHKPFMLSRVLREQGIKSKYFALNADLGGGILDVGSDYALRSGIRPSRRRLLECFYLWTVLARYDVIHSHFKSFLSESAWELDYLKRLGKTVVFHFRGCDIRYRSLNLTLQPQLNCCQECDYPIGSCDTDYQRGQVALARKYADLQFVTTPDLVDFAPGSEHIPFIYPVTIDVASITPAARDTRVFRVVTSSNHHGIDGTRFIRDAVLRLKNEGVAIELIEVENIKYRDALAIYKSADVYAGKLRMGYYNNANIETMMLGVPNMSYIRPEFRAIVPDCPIILTTPETMYDRLRYYVDHRDELRAIGEKGPEFVRTHHDPGMLARRMIARYNEAFAARRSPGDTPRTTTVVRVPGDKKVIPLTPSSSR